ncbi:hypothetical protein OYC64_004797 [Pagothenia borchgrevinki]|uniref:Spermatogenesis-associated protein 45 n=1 Tax=Pagothenia borchgrevinki TaxID=8213 RepID=A0ABD2GE40_PAGBO
MSGAEQRVLTELNVRRETWCRVEGNPHQEWERRERRHYRKHLRSTAGLLSCLPAGETRSPAGRERPPPSNLPERRHFEESYESQLV